MIVLVNIDIISTECVWRLNWRTNRRQEILFTILVNNCYYLVLSLIFLLIFNLCYLKFFPKCFMELIINFITYFQVFPPLKFIISERAFWEYFERISGKRLLVLTFVFIISHNNRLRTYLYNFSNWPNFSWSWIIIF